MNARLLLFALLLSPLTASSQDVKKEGVVTYRNCAIDVR